MPATQKALFLESRLGQFNVREHTIPTPGAGELLVRIEVAGLNPVDWKIQKRGAYYTGNYPVIIGTDVAGVVEKLGDGVSGFSIGDRVLFQATWGNDIAGFQQYTLAPAEMTAKIPPQLSFEQAATLPVAIPAAFGALYFPAPAGAGLTPPLDHSTRGKYAGKPIVVLGGATSVGQLALQFAKLSGFSPIITTASPKHVEFLKARGATHVLDRNLPFSALAAEIAKITTAPIEIVYDGVSSSDTQRTGYNLLADGGHLSLVLPQDENLEVVEGKTISMVFGVWTLPHSQEVGAKFHSQLTELLDQGSIKPNNVEVLPGGLNGVVSGLERLYANQVSATKLVVRPHETV